MWKASLLCQVVVLIGCQRTQEEQKTAQKPVEPVTPRSAAGSERGDCRPDHTCEEGLLCLSNLCVRPPAADCTLIAETLASIELGNYAPRDKRTAVVAEKRATCESLRLSKDDERCIDEAKSDKWAIAKCVPKLFPDMQPGKGTAGDCELIVGKMRQMMGSGAMNVNDPSMVKIMEQAANAIRQSCLEDGWPDALRACMIASDPALGPGGMTTCEKHMPPGLQEKMQKRMSFGM